MKKKAKSPHAVILGHRGGTARAKNLSSAKLSAIGRKGAAARWKNKKKARKP